MVTSPVAPSMVSWLKRPAIHTRYEPSGWRRIAVCMSGTAAIPSASGWLIWKSCVAESSTMLTEITAMTALAACPSAEAVIVSVPLPAAVTSPVALTVATPGVLVVHTIVCPVTALPAASRGVAVNCRLADRMSVAADWESVTAATPPDGPAGEDESQLNHTPVIATTPALRRIDIELGPPNRQRAAGVRSPTAHRTTFKRLRLDHAEERATGFEPATSSLGSCEPTVFRLVSRAGEGVTK